MLNWDEAVMMPTGGGRTRAESMATLAAMAHRLITAGETAELIEAAAAQDELGPWQRANLREIKTIWRNATALPESLVIARSRASSLCEQAWRTARPAHDWQSIEPLLTEVVELTRQVATCLGEAAGLDPYDALLDQYETGVNQAMIDPIFAELKAFLPDFVEQVIAAQGSVHPFPKSIGAARQGNLGRALMAKLGFDFERGRLDTSHHPFCGGDPDDTRITTRYDEQEFLSSMMAVLHETGHALYQQGLPRQWRGQPVGNSLGAVIHESQSLLMEMQVCRSREFVEFAAPLIRQHLDAGSNDPAWDVDNLHRHSIRVAKGFIRVDADEVTYPLHVILRYELERALLSGDLTVARIPEAWNEKMQAYLQIDTRDNLADGCMQDVHWFGGLIGYFPTYTLGALTAAQLFARAKLDEPGIEASVAQGDFAPLLTWLRKNIHVKGALRQADELIVEVTGAPLGTDAFRAHLQSRYLSAG
ncbi:MAG: carboxypeptidase M32 [Gammaproteobacteria bacterium]|nr:MAG: carboxypeptidase M32 [Gammaproteobacteria bacterium]